LPGGLDGYRLILTDGRRGEFALPEAPNVGHLACALAALTTVLLRPVAALGLVGQSVLQLRERRAARRRNLGAVAFLPSDMSAE
jgi:hypothetical protein